MLTTEDLVKLLMEKTVKIENCQIRCKGSFLASLAQLQIEMRKKDDHERSYSL